MREELGAAVKAAMKAGDKERLSTLRMMSAAVKDKDIAVRYEGRPDGASDGEIVEVFAKLVKSREDSARLYDEGGRPELAAKERAEIAVVRDSTERVKASLRSFGHYVPTDVVRELRVFVVVPREGLAALTEQANPFTITVRNVATGQTTQRATTFRRP